MENNQNQNSNYEAVIWLLLTGFKDQVYTPSTYLLDTIKPKIEDAVQDTTIQIYDSTKYNFKITSSFKDYLDMFLVGTEKFENALVLLSYTEEKYIVRDFYLAGLAKQFTCWDTAYLCCPNKSKIQTQVFDFLIEEQELPTALSTIIHGDRKI